MTKVTKESVNYRKATDMKRCGNCIMFRLHVVKFDVRASCTLVEGDIKPTYTCDRWERR